MGEILNPRFLFCSDLKPKQNHRVTGTLRSQDDGSNLQPNTPTSVKPDHVVPHLLLLLTRLNTVTPPLPWQPLPRFDHPFSEGNIPVIQPEAVSPILSLAAWEESLTSTTLSCQGAAQSNQVSLGLVFSRLNTPKIKTPRI